MLCVETSAYYCNSAKTTVSCGIADFVYLVVVSTEPLQYPQHAILGESLHPFQGRKWGGDRKGKGGKGRDVG